MNIVHGVGINDLPKGSCSVIVDGKSKIPQFYNKWQSMIYRCYSKKMLDKRPTYTGCTVCDEWKFLSNFKRWLESHPIERQSWDIDKDILFPDNKIYSPETCILVPSWVNLFVRTREAARGDYLIGASYDKRSKKFRSHVNVGKGEMLHLGYFNDEMSAHLAWKTAKRNLVISKKKELDEIDPRLYAALLQRYN